ncbi:MAG TPA: 50S ribosomal protein P1 [Pyrodictium sp.]|nr:50S ribosomal protein P1 [Pyrodictium sp.]
MEYIYASLMLHSAGKEINEENLRKVLEAAGIQVDEVRLKAVVAALKEINIDEVIKSATAMPVAPVGVPAAAAQPAAEEKKEEKKEEEEKKEKKEEGVSEEQLAAGLESLFGF